MPKLKLFLTLALCAATLGARADDKAVLITLPSGAMARDISSNGMVVGELTSGGGFYWLPSTGDIFVGGRSAETVSLSGDIINGIALDPSRAANAAIWQRGADWRVLGSVVPNAVPCDALLSSTYGASDDGKVIVGLAWNGCNFARAFRWEESTGMVDLGSTVEGRSSRANGVSGDGRVVVGWQDDEFGLRRGAKWIDGKQELYRGPSIIMGEAHAANRDGSIVVGQACEFASIQNLQANQQAWMWTSRDGVRCLQPPRFIVRNNFIGQALATSEDGRVIGGAHSFGPDSEAILWIDQEPVYLKDYLIANGVPNAFEDWLNTGFITGVSRDGRMLVGTGAGRRDFQGYIVMLPKLGAQP